MFANEHSRVFHEDFLKGINSLKTLNASKEHLFIPYLKKFFNASFMAQRLFVLEQADDLAIFESKKNHI